MYEKSAYTIQKGLLEGALLGSQVKLSNKTELEKSELTVYLTNITQLLWTLRVTNVLCPHY